MSDALNKIKARIKALSDKTVSNGCTEAEAVSAMNMVSKLLNEFNLNMSECDVKKEDTVQKKFKFTTAVQYVSGGLLVSISKFCSVKVWSAPIVVKTNTINRVSGSFRQKKIVDGCYFFGFEQDIQMAEYLYNTLNSAIYNEIQLFKLSDMYKANTVSRKTLSTSFEHGINSRLIQRLNELKAQMKSEVAASGKNALVVIKDQIVETDYNNLNLNLRAGNKSAYTVRSGNAYSEGHKAGDKINLQRPISGDNSSQVRLS